MASFSPAFQFCKCIRQISSNPKRYASSRANVIIGVYKNEKDEDFVLSRHGKQYNEKMQGKLQRLVEMSNPKKAGDIRTFYDIDEQHSSVTVVNIGKKGVGVNDCEQIDEGKEQIRRAAGASIKHVRSLGIKDVSIDPFGDAEATAEGVTLGLYSFDELKSKDVRKTQIKVGCLGDESMKSWNRGEVLGKSQNFARRLMDMPANLMTPTIFADTAGDALEKTGKVKVIVRDRKWAEDEKMGAFICIGKGSAEPIKFLEIDYKGSESNKHLALVGKGVTFDTGGISIKPSAKMDEMRADMGGAACTVGTLLAIAKLGLPINVKGYIPLCENMPSSNAVKPGDVVTAKNGKTIQVDNTDAEGRLILADALCYAELYNPDSIIDMATLTGAAVVALGQGTSSAVFTSSLPMWQRMEKASIRTGDRVWRLPLWEHFTKQLKKSPSADVNNIAIGGGGGGSSTGAAFLKEFVKTKEWMHIDIAPVMNEDGSCPYMAKGMAGRPTRTIVEYLNMLSKEK